MGKFEKYKHNVKWSSLSKKNLLISDSLKVKIQVWIIKHSSVNVYLLINGTILVRDSKTDKKTNRIGDCLMKMSIGRFHNDMIKSNDECGLSKFWKGNNLLVSDTVLCYIIPIYVKQFTSRYKQMCR